MTTPMTTADSISEILAIADALERAAAAQYAKFGQCMRQVGHDEVAEVFEALAAEEQQHVESVARLSASSPEAAKALDPNRWALPVTLSSEEIGPPAMLTPYKALSIAVLAEEKAFVFWSYVASNSRNEPVRRQAEAMARQELVHAAKLRHARRRAYHDDPAHGDRRIAASGAETDLVALRRTAAQHAAEAVDFLSAAALRLDMMSDEESAELLRQVAEDLRSGDPADLSSDPIEDNRLSTLRRIELSAVAGRAGILFDAAGRLEQLLERQLEMLEHSSESEATEDMQRLGDLTARCVARVNARLYAIEPSLAGLTSDNGPRPAPVQASA